MSFRSNNKKLSIKFVTVGGFFAAILPLVIALLYGSNQINTLAQDNANNIVDVAWITNNHRLLNQSISQLQRTSSQFIILEEQDLMARIAQQLTALRQLITDIAKRQQHEQLSGVLAQLSDALNAIHQQLSNKDISTIEQLQRYFADISQQLNQVSSINDQLISQYVSDVEIKAQNARSTMLTSLLIIPASLLVALAFVLVITRPLEVLAKQIKRLEQGKFDQEVNYSGAKEVQAIGHALEQMRSQLQQLELQKSSFIRHISHELKTPLAAIREGTELLYDNSVGDLNDAQQEIANIIRQDASRLQVLIEDLLDFNIVLDSTSLISLMSVNVHQIFDQCVSARKLDLQAKNIQVIVPQQPSVISIKSNKKQLSVIFDNLLSNAIKYSPKDGKITFKASSTNTHIKLAISDQGPGIASQQLPHVFDAFFQGDPANNSLIKSSGLGLTIVKELIRRLNGDIRLENNQEKTGLVVFIEFPIQQGKE